MSAPFGKSQKIVIVEDNYPLADIYKTRLELLGYTVFVAYDGIQALAVIEHEIPDLVLLDLMVPKKAGDQILEEMRDSSWGKDIKVMVISNLNESEAPAGLRNLGIEGYAVKANLSNDQLDQLVDAILKPAHQVEDVVLGHENVPELRDAPQQVPMPVQADPYSGTRLQGQATPPRPAAPPVMPRQQPSLRALQPQTAPAPQPAPSAQATPQFVQMPPAHASQLHIQPARTQVIARRAVGSAPAAPPKQYADGPVSDMKVMLEPIGPRPLTIPPAGPMTRQSQPIASAPELPPPSNGS